MTSRDTYALMIAVGFVVTAVATAAGFVLVPRRSRCGSPQSDARSLEERVQSAAIVYDVVEVRTGCPAVADLLREGILDARNSGLARCSIKCLPRDGWVETVAHCDP